MIETGRSVLQSVKAPEKQSERHESRERQAHFGYHQQPGEALRVPAPCIASSPLLQDIHNAAPHRLKRGWKTGNQGRSQADQRGKQEHPSARMDVEVHRQSRGRHEIDEDVLKPQSEGNPASVARDARSRLSKTS